MSFKRFVKVASCCCGALLLTACATVSDSPGTQLFHTDFSEARLGEEPEDFFILDGEFIVEKLDDNAVLKLSESLLGNFGALFGPRRKENLKASLRVRAESRKRTMPAFAVGLNGRSGMRFKVAPALRQIQLVQNGEVVAHSEYKWMSGQWVRLSLALLKTGEKEWTYSATIRGDDDSAPESPALSYKTSKPPTTGKASLWGFAYSEKPIYFDDIAVYGVGEKE